MQTTTVCRKIEQGSPEGLRLKKLMIFLFKRNENELESKHLQRFGETNYDKRDRDLLLDDVSSLEDDGLIEVQNGKHDSAYILTRAGMELGEMLQNSEAVNS